MSGCNDEADQCEKRKSIEAAMGDVLGKESSRKPEHDENTDSEDQRDNDGRQEADGAPAESLPTNDKDDARSTVTENPAISRTQDVAENEQELDIAGKETVSEKDSTLLSSDSLVGTNSPPERAKGPCCCDACKDRRDLLTEQLEEVTRLQGLWMELRQHIRSVFRAAMDPNRDPRSPRLKHDKAHLDNMHDIILQLCKRDPHQLFMRLEGQAQEFVVETKVSLLDLLRNRTSNIPAIFLTALLDGYDAILSAAADLASLVKPLENEHLSKFNVTWDCLNKRLYQSCIYTDPHVQNNLPPFIGQLRKVFPLMRFEYQGLVRRYLAFDDEMTRIGDMWPEAERLIDEYNQEQATLQAKQKMLREDWELFKARRKLSQQPTWKKTGLNEFDKQLLALATLGTVGALNTNSRPPSPNSELSLDTSDFVVDPDFLESLIQDPIKSAHLRLADMVGALASTDAQADMNGHSIGPPTSLNGHCSEPEYWFNYECAVNHILNYGFVTPPPSPRSESPCNDERGDGEGSEGEASRSEEQKCECHVCTKPRTSPTRIGKGSPLHLNLHTTNFNPFPPISNGVSGGPNCTASNGPVDMNGVYPHLYNLHAALASVPALTSTEPSKTPTGRSVDKKLRYFGPQIRKKSEETEVRKKQRKDSPSDSEDTDLRETETEPQPCPCVYQHAKELVERKKEVLENMRCSCLLKSKQKWDACPCLEKPGPDPGTTNGHAQPESPTLPAAKATSAPKKPSSQPNTNNNPTPQIQTRHSTTQTPNVNHNHNNVPHPGANHAHSHGPLPDLVKGSGNAHKGHTHANHAPHACHKQANVEQIKRVSCSDIGSGDGDCSDSGSSQEDSCSTSSSTPRDSSRHCDCCYCEVFGHGVPSVAPVSRNYNEMRERLRQLLTKKKAKKCKAVCSPAKTPVESSPPNVNCTTPTPQVTVPVPRSNTPVPVIPAQNTETRDQRDLEELLEFIEGNQNANKKDNKKAEKKARQKQKKLEEKMKKDKDEAEHQKLIELQKKTPEVTITVVDPHKPQLQRLLPSRTLPEVSILPAVITPTMSRPVNKKKDKEDATKVKSAPVGQQKPKTVLGAKKTDENLVEVSKIKSISGVDKVDGVKASRSAGVPEERDAKYEKKCKKERQKLKREAAKEALAKEAEMAKSAPEVQPQIVTIKRVMESSSAEPTVTITLKGQTPAEDKVLFTLVNGQTKELSSKGDQAQKAGGKKKKNKSNANQQQQAGKPNATQQSNAKQQVRSGTEAKTKTEQAKVSSKQTEEKVKQNQQQPKSGETKGTKSKKDKKNQENKENVMQQPQNKGNSKNQQRENQQVANEVKKKQSKVNTGTETPVAAIAQNQQQNPNPKKSNGQSNQDKNNQNIKNQSNGAKTKSINQKNQNVTANVVPKGINTVESQNTTPISSSPLSSQFKDIGVNSKINIDNLRLPPGITITKVNTPVKPMPVRSAPLPKLVSPPKQTTIIAAPMSRGQSNYASPQAGGNVIVVDTGKLKQDLLPKTNDKDSSKDNQQKQSTNGKKKKKKNKNPNGNNNSSSGQNCTSQGTNISNGHVDEQARIVHNPGSNMVTIRNPAFGPPKAEPTQQAAIIKVSENGMVTIRSPALQQAINAGLTPPPKPDFIIKGDASSAGKTLTSHDSPGKQNGMIPSSLAELRSRLTPDCTGLTGLANIHISKVTGGQSIPENGINLKGTSVTLTKVRSEAVMENVQQAKTAVREVISATMAASSGSGKGKKKKKKGNGTRQNGDDWNLVESVFTPKDIDLEDGEMDDAERELEAFKRFCLQSVPPARKEKVNLNIKDIVLKKKSQTATAIAAN